MARAKDEWQWGHTSSLISFLVNVNSAKGAWFTPDRFNPYKQQQKGQSNASVRENLNSMVGVRLKNAI